MKKFLTLSPPLAEYISNHNKLPHPQLARVNLDSQRHSYPMMQSSHEQAAFMHVLTRMIGAKRCIEVGCFTGFSAIAIGSALPKDGKLITLDVDHQTGEMARKSFVEAGLGNVIELRLGKALESLENILTEFKPDSFDLAFIDADKTNYQAYYESCLKLVRPGGTILIDNVLWSGSVVDAKDQSNETTAIRVLNDFILNDSRVYSSMIQVSDGITLVCKK